MEKNSLITTSMPPITSFEAYKAYVNQLPTLSESEEIELATNLKNNNCIVSAQKLVISQLKTVLYISNKYKGYGIPQEDLVQEGNIGLMKAVKNFDLTHKVRLYTYALLWIKAEIQSYILKNWKIVKIATTQNLKKLFFNFRGTQKELIELGVSKQELIQTLAKKLNVSEEEARNIQNYFSSEDFSINQEMSDETNFDIPDYNTPELEYQEKHDALFYESKIKDSLEKLNKNQRKVIELRYYTEEKYTHKEISKILNLSSERVRQIETEALDKLKKLMLH